MAPKLSDSDKSTIVELYQQPDESTATLASRYGVSSSTISRILKQALSEDRYKEIVKQKKGGGSKPQPKEPEPSEAKPSPVAQQAELEFPPEASSEESVSSEPKDQTTAKTPPPPILKKNTLKLEQPLPKANSPASATSDWGNEISSDLLDLNGLDEDDLEEEDLEDLDTDLDDDDLDDDSQDDDDDDDDDDDFANDGTGFEFSINPDTLSVLPFSEAKLPRTCYLIIDRAAELITRPLKAFSDLGEVPAEEVDEQTLPIFDNHRVAKRFVNRRTQRIVKVPDAQVLRKTSSYLLDKGITRLLLAGQIYALMDDEDDYEYEDDYE